MESKKHKPSSYTYLRYMRDGSTKEITALVRSRSAGKKIKKSKANKENVRNETD